MDFFNAQETLSAFQWILRALIAFIFLLLATKLMGVRSISQLRLIDFTIALILGNIMAHPLSDEKLGMKGSLITTSVLVSMYLFTQMLNLKWGLFRKWNEPTAFPLIISGEIHYGNLTKARITIDHLLSEGRKQQIEDVHKVALAQWEPDGSISFFLSPQARTLTPEDMQLVKDPYSFSSIIIKEGKVLIHSLHSSGKDSVWLDDKLRLYNIQISDVLLATLNTKEELNFYLYD